jgi:ribose transport system substrate-binding protein
MWWRRPLAAAAVVVFALAVTGCGGGDEGGGTAGGGQKARKLTLVQGIANEPFYITMWCGAKEEAAKQGVQIDVTAPDQWDVAQQTSVVNAVAAKRPDSVLIAPVDDTAMEAPVRQLEQNGSKVILVDTTLKNASVGLSRISSDNTEGGRLAARTLAQLTGDKGKVLVLGTTPGTPTTVARVNGFKEEIAKHSSVQLVKVEFPGDDAAAAASKVTATLAAHPDLAGIFASNLVTGEGAGNGLRQAGKIGDVKFVQFDASPKQVEDLQSGVAQALIAQEPDVIGAEGVKQAIAALDNREVQKEIKTELVAVTKETMGDPNVSKHLYKASC